jgi:hypothetical protein
MKQIITVLFFLATFSLHAQQTPTQAVSKLMGVGLPGQVASEIVSQNQQGVDGSTSVRLGYEAGASTLPTSSVAIGANALQVATGIQNTMVGRSSGVNISTGTNNVGVGNRALAELLGASNNTAVGGGPMDSLESGNDNTCIGKNCLQGLVSGSSNVAVGYGAGTYHYNASASNVDIGYNTGPCSNTQEQDKLYINNACGTPLLGGDFAGFYINFKAPTSAPADATLIGATGYANVTVWVDEVGNAIKFKVKYSNNSTVRTASIALP